MFNLARASVPPQLFTCSYFEVSLKVATSTCLGHLGDFHDVALVLEALTLVNLNSIVPKENFRKNTLFSEIKPNYLGSQKR